jgi:hypothetical protein
VPHGDELVLAHALGTHDLFDSRAWLEDVLIREHKRAPVHPDRRMRSDVLVNLHRLLYSFSTCRHTRSVSARFEREPGSDRVYRWIDVLWLHEVAWAVGAYRNEAVDVTTRHA